MTVDRITYVGHATALIELGGARLLTDPVLGARLLHIRRHADKPDPVVSEQIDAVLISHLHHDHLDFASLRRLGGGVPIVVPRGGAKVLRRRGFREALELGRDERIEIAGVEVAATHATHDGRRYPVGRGIDAMGFDLRAGRRVYFAGDTDLFGEMSDLAGGIDAALLPVGGWGPKVGRGHLDPRKAAEAAAILRPRFAIPIHWGTLLRIGLSRRANEILHTPPRRFAAQLAELAPAIEPAVLEPGESLELSSPTNPD